jgi:hypothetical protein
MTLSRLAHLILKDSYRRGEYGSQTRSDKPYLLRATKKYNIANGMTKGFITEKAKTMTTTTRWLGSQSTGQ